MTSQYDALVDIYDVWAAADPASAPSHDFYVQMCCETEGLVVELGVGTGRIAIDVARNGKDITGVDISTAMLERCRRKADQAGVSHRIDLIHSDAQSFELRRKANLVTFPFRSIGHLLSREDKRRALNRIYRQLMPGGLFVFDHYVFDEHWARDHDGVPRLMHGRINPGATGLFVWDIYRYDFRDQRMNCFIAVDKTDAKGRVIERTYYPLCFSWITPEQVRELAKEVGFQVEALYGDFFFGEFSSESSDQVWLLRRPK